MCAVIGEALVDMVQVEPDGPYVAHPGGSPLNTAVGLQRLGHRTHLLARLSSRPLGESVWRHAVENGLDLTASVRSDGPATLAFVTLDDECQASYDFYVEGAVDWGWTDAELSRLPGAAAVVHTGSLAALLAPGAAALERLFARLHDEGGRLLSFDPNVRPAVAGDRAAAVVRVERFVASSDAVKVSSEDLSWLYPDDDPDGVLERWLALGPALVVMTAGSDGCKALTARGDELEVSGHQIAVTDTIGAGDAFASGLLSGLLDAGVVTPAALSLISADVATAVLRRATLVAALTCQRSGADPPTRKRYAEAANDAGELDPWLAATGGDRR